jgi:hypothetical protein
MTLTKRRSQHRIHEARGARELRRPRQVHRIVDDGRSGHPIEVQDLKQAQSRDHEHGRIELRQRPSRHVLNEVIEPALPAKRSRHDRSREGAIAFLLQS